MKWLLKWRGNWRKRSKNIADEWERKSAMRCLPNRKLARQTKVKPPNTAHRFLVICIRIGTNSDGRKSVEYDLSWRKYLKTSLCIENARIVYRLNDTYSVYWYFLNVDVYNEKDKMHQRVDEILLICHNDYYFITLCMFARGWLEDSWYKEYSWTRTHTTCKAVVQRGRTVRSITIGCCPRRLRSARRLAVWKPLDLAQTERRPADRRISINLVWYRNVGPLRDGWSIHRSFASCLPQSLMRLVMLILCSIESDSSRLVANLRHSIYPIFFYLI